MFGWIAASHQLGASFAAYGAGLLRTDLGSYTQAFMISGGLCMGASIMVLFIGRKRDAGTDKLQPAALAAE